LLLIRWDGIIVLIEYIVPGEQEKADQATPALGQSTLVAGTVSAADTTAVVASTSEESESQQPAQELDDVETAEPQPDNAPEPDECKNYLPCLQ
jgi:hypothetical protein